MDWNIKIITFSYKAELVQWPKNTAATRIRVALFPPATPVSPTPGLKTCGTNAANENAPLVLDVLYIIFAYRVYSVYSV